MRLDFDGMCTLACAGHPAPYLNDREVELAGALPLGIDPSVAYEEITSRIHPGACDELSLLNEAAVLVAAVAAKSI
jgi:hypothetical protein